MIRRAYSVAGRRMLVEAADARLMEIAANFLAHYYFEPANDDGAPAAMQLEWLHAPEPLDALESFVLTHGICETDRRRYVMRVDDSEVIVSMEGGVRVAFGSTPRAQHRVSLTNILSYAMQAVLRRAGRFDCHAAAVVPADSDAAMLIVGDSGHGKSTLTLALTHAGWRYLSDDYVVLRHDAGAAHVHALRRLFAVAPEPVQALAISSEILGANIVSDPRKRHLDPSRVFPASFVESARPRVLLFPSIADREKSLLTPIASAQALARMLRNCPWSVYDRPASRDFLALLATLTNQSRAYTLDAGRDILGRPGTAHELLAPIAEGR